MESDLLRFRDASRDNLALRWACENGHTGIAQWLVTAFWLGPNDARAVNNYALRRACERGHTATAQWLLDWLELPDDIRAEVLSQVDEPSPKVAKLLTDWSKPPGPEDKQENSPRRRKMLCMEFSEARSSRILAVFDI
jgi:hypothetical protein